MLPWVRLEISVGMLETSPPPPSTIPLGVVECKPRREKPSPTCQTNNLLPPFRGGIWGGLEGGLGGRGGGGGRQPICERPLFYQSRIKTRPPSKLSHYFNFSPEAWRSWAWNFWMTSSLRMSRMKYSTLNFVGPPHPTSLHLHQKPTSILPISVYNFYLLLSVTLRES